MLTGFSAGLVFGIINGNYELVFMALIAIPACTYFLLITSYFQRSKNYLIEFLNDNSLEGFKLFYKGKLVDIKYIIDNEGRIAYANDKNKLSCFSYADGTKMSHFTKYRVMNYFTLWLHNNNLLSNKTTVTLEKTIDNGLLKKRKNSLFLCNILCY